MNGSKPTLVDLFSGAGGLSVGFLKAGFEILCAVDCDDVALKTYGENLGSHAFSADLSSFGDIPKATVIAGGPPCQGFSSAGLRRNGDNRNSLVSSFANLIAESKPSAFVFENVEGFLTAENGARVIELLNPLLKTGYRIHLRKINAANYGIPQHRKRVIAIGGLGWEPRFPEPTHTAFGAPGALLATVRLPPTPTVDEALKSLSPATTKPPGVPQGHYFRPLEGVDLKRAHALRQGMTMRDLSEELQHESYRRRAYRRVMDGTPTERRGGAPAGIRRLKANEPSKAITGGARSEFLHPHEDRALTTRECARLQTFDDDFIFLGTASQQGQLIGNAVPPMLAYQIALSLIESLPGRIISAMDGGALLSFVPTLSDGASPALSQMTQTINKKFSQYIAQEELPLWR